MPRNRSTGWKHAKLSGHANESELEYRINSNQNQFDSLCTRILGVESLTGSVEIGGLNETNVSSILGNTTKSKTDMKVNLKGYKSINISIKKSLGGQLYLIKTSRFIDGFEKHFKTEIPEDVKIAMMIFWGEHKNIINIVDKFGEKDNIKIKNYENRKHRLVAKSLLAHNEIIASNMIDWFKKNIENITLFCFSYGLASEPSDWANYIWYKNLVDDKNYDYIFEIEDISKSSGGNSNFIDFGNINGGTTIQLPFGFVQWHQGQMQFHHTYNKILNICKKL